MIALKKYIKKAIPYISIALLICFSFSFMLHSNELEWVEVSRTNNELIYIFPNSINYDNRGFLSVLTKYTEMNLDDQNILKTDSFVMAIDCENRLFSKLPVNGNIKQVKTWENPINNKVIKKSMINICAY